jgi:hypothetical protein
LALSMLLQRNMVESHSNRDELLRRKMQLDAMKLLYEGSVKSETNGRNWNGITAQL